MVYEVIKSFKVKVKGNIVELKEGQTVFIPDIPEGKAIKLVSDGRIKPIEPYVTDFGSLVIPSNSDRRFYWWAGGQSVCDTLKELGRCDLIEKYKSPYCN